MVLTQAATLLRASFPWLDLPRYLGLGEGTGIHDDSPSWSQDSGGGPSAVGEALWSLCLWSRWESKGISPVLRGLFGLRDVPAKHHSMTHDQLHSAVK